MTQIVVPGRLTPVTSCRSCHAPMSWRETTNLGADGNYKRVPLDPDPVENGNIVIDSAGFACYVGKNDRVDPNRPRYVSHFATCPNAAHHRRR